MSSYRQPTFKTNCCQLCFEKKYTKEVNYPFTVESEFGNREEEFVIIMCRDCGKEREHVNYVIGSNWRDAYDYLLGSL